jgi:hypothetical protein
MKDSMVSPEGKFQIQFLDQVTTHWSSVHRKTCRQLRHSMIPQIINHSIPQEVKEAPEIPGRVF